VVAGTPAILLRGYGPYVFSFLAALAIQFLIFPRIDDYTITILNIIGINIILAVSLNVVNGYTGQFSLGHAAFMALGAYTSGAITYYGSHMIWGTNQAVGGFPRHWRLVLCAVDCRGWRRGGLIWVAGRLAVPAVER
jgi:ABC-type branched-subunit amino acid transport system permease subunit